MTGAFRTYFNGQHTMASVRGFLKNLPELRTQQVYAPVKLFGTPRRRREMSILTSIILMLIFGFSLYLAPTNEQLEAFCREHASLSTATASNAQKLRPHTERRRNRHDSPRRIEQELRQPLWPRRKISRSRVTRLHFYT